MYEQLFLVRLARPSLWPRFVLVLDDDFTHSMHSCATPSFGAHFPGGFPKIRDFWLIGGWGETRRVGYWAQEPPHATLIDREPDVMWFSRDAFGCLALRFGVHVVEDAESALLGLEVRG